MRSTPIVPVAPEYPAFLTDIKSRIQAARLSAGRAVNRELVLLYWDLGRSIVEKQTVQGWGESVVERLAADLRAEFPDMRGFATRSLWNMRRLFQAYGTPEILPQVVAELSRRQMKPILPQPVAELKNPPTGPQAVTSARRDDGVEILRQAVAEIPWGHHLLILDKVEALPARLFYLRATAQFGWSRAVLLNQIKAQAYERAKAEKKTHNFTVALPEHFAEQADEMLKSRYNLEFLGIARPMREREMGAEKGVKLCTLHLRR